MGLSFFIGVYVARYLGPAKLGLLSYSQSFAGLFLAVANLGLDEIVIRELVNKRHSKEHLLGTAFCLKIFGSALAVLMVLGMIQFTNDSMQTRIYVLVFACALLFNPIQVIDFYFRAEVKSKYVVYAKIVQQVVSVVVKIVLVLNDAELIWFVNIVILEGFVSLFGMLAIYLSQRQSILSWRFKRKLAKSLLMDSLPLIMSGIAISIYMKIDQVMIKQFLNASAVGNYSIAVKLTEVWYFFPTIITNSLYPSIIKAKQVGEEHYHNRLQNLYDLMTWLSLINAVSISLFSNWIVFYIFGDQYADSGQLLAIYVWASVFVFSGVASTKWYLVENLNRHLLYRTCVGGGINIVLNLTLLPALGVKGAAIATVLSYAIVSYFSMAFFKKSRINFILVTKSFNPYSALKRLLNA